MAYDVYKTEKITHFFAGYPSTALNNLKLGIQIPLYDYLKDNKQLNTFYSAGISKFISTTLFYPLDIIRTLQRNSSETLSIPKSLKLIYKQNGFTGFYRGVILYNFYSTPNFIILMYITDFLLKYKNNTKII
jgi:solute carrier family 25 folate transporter 32